MENPHTFPPKMMLLIAMTNPPIRAEEKYILNKLCFCDHIFDYITLQSEPSFITKAPTSTKTTGPSGFKETKLSTFHTVHRTTVFTASLHKCYVILTHACYVEACLPSCEKTHAYHGTYKINVLIAHKAEGKRSLLRCQTGFLNNSLAKMDMLKRAEPKEVCHSWYQFL